MEKEFLRRVYWTASSEGSDPKKGDRLQELYQRIHETYTASEALDKRLGAFGISMDSVSDDVFHLAEVHEMQGFINGFRLGMLLSKELQEGWAFGHGYTPGAP